MKAVDVLNIYQKQKSPADELIHKKFQLFNHLQVSMVNYKHVVMSNFW